VDDGYEVNAELEEGGEPVKWPIQSLGRREFLGLAGAAGAALALGGNAFAAAARRNAQTPGQRAIAGLKALKLPSDTKLTVFAEDLTILGSKVTQARFEKQSGIKLDIQSAPFLQYADKVFADAATKAGSYDLVYVEPNRYGDLDNAGYLTDLTAWVKKYNPALNDMIAPQNRVWAIYNGKYVGLPTDGDVFILYYRKDLLNDPKEQTAFKAKYGRALRPPKTYDEYNDLLAFFTRPDQNLYGAVEWRVKGVTYWWFWQRLWSAGGTYFRPDMSAAINSAAGVKALTDLKAMNAYMPKDVLSYGYTETVAAMTNGSAFSNITWPAAGKNVSDPKTSKTVGKWAYTTVPGYIVKGKPNPRTMSAPSYGLIVSAHAKADKEAAYLYAQWMTSPENQILADKNGAGNTDVIRKSIFSDPQMRKIFPGAGPYLDSQEANLRQAVPDPILPGYSEYTQALEIEISNFMTGGKSAKSALDDAASKWDKITDQLGRDKQKQIYTNFIAAYNGK
jgi:multiple sugar transport system substrate-binding protein